MKRVLASLTAVCGYVMLVTAVSGAIRSPQGGALDPLQPLAFLVGRWEGSSEGQPGRGTVQREYTRILNSRFIRVQNTSVYLPQDKNPNGETHEDLGVYSFDKSRGRAVFRQFHVEGFVNQYVADADPQPGRVAFTSEAIENIPPGYRARETYVVLGPDAFEEVFELAEPGKPFQLYSRAHLKRVR
jgi:THAP4-like, heme-binding beta-barrel domain